MQVSAHVEVPSAMCLCNGSYNKIIMPSPFSFSPMLYVNLTCDQAFFFLRSAKEKQCETRRSVGQSGFRPLTLALLYFPVPPKKERLIAG